MIQWEDLLRTWKTIAEKEKRGKRMELERKGILSETRKFIDQLWENAEGQFFYARFVVGEEKKMITGLVTEWMVDEEGRMLVKFAEEKLKNGRPIKKIKEEEMKIEEVKEIVVFKTKTGKVL
jgi:hypothetical protein